MNVHTEQEFKIFMSQLLETNVTLEFFTDFEKCNENVKKVAIRLNQLNYLIGQTNMESAIRELWTENPQVFSVLDILIAVRAKDKKKAVDEEGVPRLLTSYFDSVDGVIGFIHKTGLAHVFKNRQIKNLVDYVFGVEVGLDTNARKNRSGDIMENLVESILEKNGIKYRKEVYSTEFPVVDAALGEDKKRFDFVIETPEKTYLMEVNFYSGGGSKLNEVARSYTDIAPKINACKGYDFVWITDGVGWNSARNKLQEAFCVIQNVYNLTTIKDFVKQISL